ncbi:hypothetical protein D3C77_623470 [compost metagenome]
MGDVIEALRLECCGQWLAMVDDLVGAQLAHPVLRLWTRSCADHREPGQLAGQLSQNRADTTGGADDQQALTQVVLTLWHLEALEQQFPSGYCR